MSLLFQSSGILGGAYFAVDRVRASMESTKPSRGKRPSWHLRKPEDVLDGLFFLDVKTGLAASSGLAPPMTGLALAFLLPPIVRL